MFEICLASLRAREKWVFFCCLNVGDLGINGVNMSVETEVDDDDNLHMV
ncbi:hypothetical protein MtrunA17_Chr5g0398001 [Medicago truncatula]|uniref:Uncharacterized protein n=1 Tax=Medicago truncatula TaxID=3880 RepID=A0A396HJY1_MEDTR|nr:hypothetical protein MtrunA17_Chr5g0398001 [Medicago truncatula]